jgi:predicted HicB family RNase H-like nuclease
MKRTDLHLRLPESLAEKLKEQAQKSGRSLNAEIVQRLLASLSYGP